MPGGRALHHVSVPVPILQRGFWLYIWKVGLPEGDHGHYVGMTGDTATGRAQSAANHVSANLGFTAHASAIRRYLHRRHRVHLENCRSLEFISFGPVYPEPAPTEYQAVRGKVAALANRLWDRLNASGYEMLNTLPRTPGRLDEPRWNDVCSAFQGHFPRIRTGATVNGASALRLHVAAAPTT